MNNKNGRMKNSEILMYVMRKVDNIDNKIDKQNEIIHSRINRKLDIVQFRWIVVIGVTIMLSLIGYSMWG